MRTAAFEAYVGNADDGRNSVPRILSGSVLILAIMLAGAAAMIAAAVAAHVALHPIPPDQDLDIYVGALDTPLGVAATFLAVACLWPATWVALRLVHRRALAGVLGSERLLRGADFRRACAAMAVVLIVSLALSTLVDPTLASGDISWMAWFAGVVPLALVILAQSSAEELVFRGYLVQSLAARFRSPLVWALIPLLLFTLAHWNGIAHWWMNAAMLVNIGAFAVALTAIVVKTGNLAAAMGAHFVNNVAAVLVISSDTSTDATALFRGRSVDDPAWTMVEAAALGLVGIVTSALLVLLLVHRRSPFRLSARAAPPAHPDLAHPRNDV